jgi:hypothetical protein
VIFGSANEEQRYREQTNKLRIPSVAFATFKCVTCKEYRPLQGRRVLVKGAPRFGYRCARCVGSSGKAVESDKKGRRA